AGYSQGNHRPHAAEPEAHLRAHALVSTGADRDRTARRAHAVRAQRAPRSRAARLSPQRRDRRPQGSPDLSEAVEHERDGQGGARGARPDLGARQDAPPSRLRAQLEFAAVSMGLVSLLTAAFYYRPLLTTTVIAVVITVIYVIAGRRRKISNRLPCER